MFTMNTRLSAARIFDEDSNSLDGAIAKASSKLVVIDINAEKTLHTHNKAHTDQMKSGNSKVRNSPYKVSSSKSDSRDSSKANSKYETSAEVLARRQKQIDYGKNTIGYDNYRKSVPMSERTREHPSTPIKSLKYSRRSWDGLIRIWRHQLHKYDPNNGADDEVENDCDDATEAVTETEQPENATANAKQKASKDLLQFI